ILVPRPHNVNIVRCLWLFRHKHNADGSLNRYKACLVANGSSRLEASTLTFNTGYLSGIKPLTDQKRAYEHWEQSKRMPLMIIKNSISVAIRGAINENANDTWDLYPLTASSRIHHAFLVSQHTWHQRLRHPGGEVMRHLVSSNLISYNNEKLPFCVRLVSLKKYGREILDRAHMANCNPSRTPIDTESKLGSDDADWAGFPTTRRSTSGYCVFLSNNFLSWSSKRQSMLSYSSAEVEYRGVVNPVAQTCWLHNLLCELHTHLSSATLVYSDNVSAVYLSCNPVQHQRTKHIEIDIHFIRDLVAAGQVRFLETANNSGSGSFRRIELQEAWDETPLINAPIPINTPLDTSNDHLITHVHPNNVEENEPNPEINVEPQETQQPLRRSLRNRQPTNFDDYYTYLNEAILT
nr:ribonuclease H-like domain-containing protein [Tanacetum cinerariifolium]